MIVIKKNIIIFLSLIISFYIYLNNVNLSHAVSFYIDRKLVNNYNISVNDWCSIELKDYIVLFFLCLDRIPNISIVIA